MATAYIVYKEIKKKIDEIMNKVGYEKWQKLKQGHQRWLRNLVKWDDPKSDMVLRMSGGYFMYIPSPEHIDEVLSNYGEKLSKEEKTFLNWIKENLASDTAFTTYMKKAKGKTKGVARVIVLSSKLIEKITEGTFDIGNHQSGRYQFEAVLYHEALHQYLGHLDWGLKMNPMLANILEDLAINSDGLNVMGDRFQELKEKFGGVYYDTFRNEFMPQIVEGLKGAYIKNKNVVDEFIKTKMEKWFKTVSKIMEKIGYKEDDIARFRKIFDEEFSKDNKIEGFLSFMSRAFEMYSKGELDGLFYELEGLIKTFDEILQKLGDDALNFKPQTGEGDDKDKQQKQGREQQGKGKGGSSDPLEKGNLGDYGTFNPDDIPDEIKDIFDVEEDEAEVDRLKREADRNAEVDFEEAIENFEKFTNSDKFSRNMRGLEAKWSMRSFRVLITEEDVIDKLSNLIKAFGERHMEFEYVQGQPKIVRSIVMGRTIRKVVVDYIRVPITEKFVFAFLDTSGSMSGDAQEIVRSALCSLIYRKESPAIITEWDYDYKRSHLLNPYEHLGMRDPNAMWFSDYDIKAKERIEEIFKSLETMVGMGGTGNFHKYIATLFGIKGYEHERFKKDLEEMLPKVPKDMIEGKPLSYDALINEFVDKGNIRILMFTDSDFLAQSEVWNDEKFLEGLREKLKKGNILTVVSEDERLIRRLKDVVKKADLPEENVEIIDLRPFVKLWRQAKGKDREEED